MARRIVVTSGKGGVGKTTITANLGVELAKSGERVCLIDADIGLKNLDVLLGLEDRINYTIMDVINDMVEPMDALIRHPGVKNLFFLPASQIATKDMVSHKDIERIIERIEEHFDFILIDCPAGIEKGFKNATLPAKEALIVTNPELPAITDADRVIGLLESQGMPDTNIKVIINRIKFHLMKNGNMLTKKDIENALSIDVIGILPDSDEMIIAANKGVPIVLNDSSKITKVFNNIVRRIQGELVPVEADIDIFEKSGFMGFLKTLFSKS
ncbi:MAG: septum site-determining protein MinD [Thermotogaceae bacterium]|jgi:septum site-determining protein MinD|nr:septum site-determining protein MinD [Thermotogaceae bacterium]MDN5338411.1 septum site-determining protein MinD [Thermotogaceae bacterium]